MNEKSYIYTIKLRDLYSLFTSRW